jgi:GNAT superfamily N-acetyltransferase
MTARIPTRVPGLFLRFATEKDVGIILGFIRELADYEKLAHEVIADEQILRRSLFGGRQVAEVVIAEYEDEPVGFALFFHNFSTFLARPGIYLEDLYVRPAMRGKGIGTTLLAFLAKIAVDRGCGRFEWAVLDWNEPAIAFYKNLGAQALSDWTVYRVAGPALATLATRF